MGKRASWLGTYVQQMESHPATAPVAAGRRGGKGKGGPISCLAGGNRKKKRSPSCGSGTAGYRSGGGRRGRLEQLPKPPSLVCVSSLLVGSHGTVSREEKHVETRLTVCTYICRYPMFALLWRSQRSCQPHAWAGIVLAVEDIQITWTLRWNKTKDRVLHWQIYRVM